MMAISNTTTRRIFLFLLLLVCHICNISCTPSGAGSQACGDQIPRHPSTSAQTGVSPYSIQIGGVTYQPGSTIQGELFHYKGHTHPGLNVPVCRGPN